MADERSHPIYRMGKEEILCALLKKERGYYEVILEITEHEQLLLQGNGPVVQMTSLMKKKQILMQCIQEIDLALQPLKKHWKEKTDKSSPLDQEVQQELAQLNTLIQHILKVDEENQQVFQKKLLALREQGKTAKR